jgi:hypothetical protein
MKRFMNRKSVAIAAVVGLVLGGAGLAAAHVLGNGTATGSTTVAGGPGDGFTVSSPDLEGGPLTIDPNNFDTISASISNFTGLPLTVKQIDVAITGVTVDQNTQNPAWPPCTASQFVLAASASPGWGGPQMTSNNGVLEGPAAVWTTNLPQTVPNGDFVNGEHLATSTPPFVSPTSVNGVPPGLFLEWLDQGPNVIQNNCLGATVNVSVSAS